MCESGRSTRLVNVSVTSARIGIVNDDQTNVNGARQADRPTQGESAAVPFSCRNFLLVRRKMSCGRVGRIRGIRHAYVQRPCHLSTALTEHIEHAGPGSIYAYFLYSSDDRVEQILGSHSIPVAVRGQNLRIERTMNRPYPMVPGSSDVALELGKSLAPAASDANIEERKQTVPKWRGTCVPSRVLWNGGLPMRMSREALTNFWS